MNIAHVVHSFEPESHGGIETYVRSISSEAIRRGHRITVVSGSEKESQERRERVGEIDVLRFPALRERRDDGACTRSEEVIGRLLENEGIDVVHVHHWHNVSSGVVRLARRLNRQAVLTLHDHFSTCARFHRLREAGPCHPRTEIGTCAQCLSETFSVPIEGLEARIRNRATPLMDEVAAASTVLVLSETQREYLREMEAFASVSLEPLRLPPPLSDPVSPEWIERKKDEPLRIVSWGGLDPGKGFHVLLQACEELPVPEAVELRHYGRLFDPCYGQRLNELQRRVKLSRHGSFPQGAYERVFPQNDLAVFPSLYMETHGFVVDEAMQIGLPVLVSDRGAPKERLGDRGRALPAGDVMALRDEIERLRTEPGRLAQMRRGVPLLGPSLEEHVDRLEEVYTR